MRAPGRLVRLGLPVVVAAALVGLPAAPAGSQDDGEAPAPPPARLATPVLSARRVPDVLADQAGTDALVAEADAVMALAPSSSCLVVAEGDRTLYRRNGDLPLVPASNQKLLTTTAALDLLGPQATLRTEVRAGSVDGDGVVDGDLYVVGGGDPLLTTDGFLSAMEEGDERLVTPFEEVADAVVDAGVTEVRGDVVGDDGRYDDQRWVPSWPDRYRWPVTVGPLSALAVNDGAAGLADAPDVPTGNPSPGDPPEEAADTLITLLEERGVEVAGQGRAGRAPVGTDVVAVHESPPLADLLAEVVRWSDNYAAELLVRELDVHAGGAGTTEGGLRAVEQALVARGLPTAGTTLVDGSGLDLGNRTTCDLLSALLADLPADSPVVTGLAVAGTTGTLHDRMAGTSAEGRVRAKTGTLNTALALSGFADAQLGRTLRFAFVVNIPPEGDPDADTGLQDQLAEALVAYPAAPDPAALAPLPAQPG